MLAAGGFQYVDGALTPDDRDADGPEPVTAFETCGRVGTRVAHRWVDAGRTRSTLDLAGPGWAALTGGDPRPATAALAAFAGRPHVGVHRVDVDFLGRDELLLLRPDQVVAWRGTDPDATADALDAVLAAPGQRIRCRR